MSDWDVVLRGGRVIDPESGLDAVRDVAVAGGRVAEVGTGLSPGRADLDVTGLVVTAGFKIGRASCRERVCMLV